jgi:putative ABC transport system permease protein
MGRLLRGALAHKMRLVHTAIAAALAVSLVSGTFILTDTVERAFDTATTASPNGVDVIVRSASEFAPTGNQLAERQSVPPEILPTVEGVPGVESAWGLVWGYAQIVDKQGNAIAPQGLPTLGTAWGPTDSLTEGRAPLEPGEVAIDAVTAKENGFSLGDKIKVLFQGLVEEFTIRGIRGATDLVASTLATFDIKTAQRVLGRQDRLDAIAVKAAPGVNVEGLRAAVGGVVPDGYEAVTNDQAAQEAKESWTNALGFLTTGLLVFAAIALLVGGFIIFNTFSILVAQRTRELGLLRALGASRAQVMVSVLAEAVAVGLVASAAGVALGFGAARGLLAVMSRVGLEVPTTSVVFVPRTVAASLLCGVVVTAVAAVLPARRATQVSPVDGVRDADGTRDHSARRRLAAGAVSSLAGLGCVLTGLFTDLGPALLLLAVGGGGFFAGLALMAPFLATPGARLLGEPVVRLLGEPARLGRENAMRNPRRTAATAAALTIGLSLIGVVAILAASMKASASQAVEETLKADFVVKAAASQGMSPGIPPVAANRLRETAGVSLVSEIRAGQWGLAGKSQTLLAVNPQTVGSVHRLDPESEASARRLGDGDVIVRDTVARRHGWRPGGDVPMTFARTGTQRLRMVDTFSSTAVTGDYVISLRTYEANFAQQLDAEVRVLLSAGVDPVEGRARIEAALAEFSNVDVLDKDEVLAAQEAQVNRILVPVTGLLALSVLIALLGITNTLALSIHERTREIGLLRAIGMARRQLRSMIRSEAVIIASLGATAGVAVALFFGWAAVSAMRDVGLTELVFPVRQLLAWVGAVSVAGLLAAILPARRAAGLDVLDAVTGR